MSKQMTPLRQRMIEDMTIRNMSLSTQKIYVAAVANFSIFHRRSPDKLSFEDVRDYRLHLTSRGLKPNSINPIMGALRFFYRTTLGVKEVSEHIPYASPLPFLDFCVVNFEPYDFGAQVKLLAFVRPRPTPRIADVHHPYFFATDFIVNKIRVANDRQFIHARLIRFGCHARKFGKQRNTPLNHSLYRLSCRRCPGVKICKYRVEVRLRTQRITDLHVPWGFTPWRRKNAAISSSLANSPRCACSCPSFTAARVSSSR